MGACRCHDLGPHHPGRARRARGHDRPQCPQPSPAGLAVAASPDELTGGVWIGSVVEVLGGAIGTVMRLLPLAGITLSHLLLCRCMGTSLALRRARVDLTPTIDGEKNPHPSAVRFLTTSRVRQQTRSQPGHDLTRACEGSRLVSDRPRRPINGNQVQILALGSSHQQLRCRRLAPGSTGHEWGRRRGHRSGGVANGLATPAVANGLATLEAVGFDSAPRMLGIDEPSQYGREEVALACCRFAG